MFSITKVAMFTFHCSSKWSWTGSYRR